MDILIVDDEKDICQMMKLKLMKHDHKVTAVHTVSAASQLLTDHTCDLAFLDIHLPDGTGFDLLERFPKLAPKTVMMSAFEGKEEVSALQDMGVANYLKKPFMMARVLELVHQNT